MSGFESWLPTQPTSDDGFFGLTREVTPLMLAVRLRALGSRPSWWRPFSRARWTRNFIGITTWRLASCSAVYRNE